MLEERRREILAQVFREQNKQECDGALFGENHKCLVAMRRAEAEIVRDLRAALSDLEKTAASAGPFITAQASGVAERLGQSLDRARSVLSLRMPISVGGVEIVADTVEQITGQVNHRGERIVSDDMVRRALAGFDCGTGDPNDYKRRMRFALEAALQPS